MLPSSVTKTSEATTSRQHASCDGLGGLASSYFSRDPAGSNNLEGTDRYCAKADKDRSAEASAGTNCATSTPLCFPLEPASPGHEAWRGSKPRGHTSTCPKGSGRMVVRPGANTHNAYANCTVRAPAEFAAAINPLNMIEAGKTITQGALPVATRSFA